MGKLPDSFLVPAMRPLNRRMNDAYKILAAGRRTDSPAEVCRCFQAALDNIKPTDAIIVGMYQQFGDQGSR